MLLRAIPWRTDPLVIDLRLFNFTSMHRSLDLSSVYTTVKTTIIVTHCLFLIESSIITYDQFKQTCNIVDPKCNRFVSFSWNTLENIHSATVMILRSKGQNPHFPKFKIVYNWIEGLKYCWKFIRKDLKRVWNWSYSLWKILFAKRM